MAKKRTTRTSTKKATTAKKRARSAKTKGTATKTKAPPRKRVPEYEDIVLQRCRRQCCLCVALRRVTDVQDGQLVHLDRDRSNTSIDNLAFLCLECHKNYDRKSNRVKSYTPGEVGFYRDRLYRQLGNDEIKLEISLTASRDDCQTIRSAVHEAHQLLLKYTSEVSLTERPTS